MSHLNAKQVEKDYLNMRGRKNNFAKCRCMQKFHFLKCSFEKLQFENSSSLLSTRIAIGYWNVNNQLNFDNSKTYQRIAKLEYLLKPLAFE